MPTPEALHQRRLAREISARQQAESLLEQKSLEIYLERQERQAALQKLQESEERYRLIVELSPDAIMVQMDGKLAFANPAARRMFAENNQRRIGCSDCDGRSQRAYRNHRNATRWIPLRNCAALFTYDLRRQSRYAGGGA